MLHHDIWLLWIFLQPRIFFAEKSNGERVKRFQSQLIGGKNFGDLVFTLSLSRRVLFERFHSIHFCN